MKRTTRYQGAILKDNFILLIRHRHHKDGRTYWLLPGGGREVGESEEQCVCREMREETGLDVRVERLLFLYENPMPGSNQLMKTYLCTPVGGEPGPGYEPEIDVSQIYAIVDVMWVDLRDPNSWLEAVKADLITYPQLLELRQILFPDAPI